jgi:hypothetical protein
MNIKYYNEILPEGEYLGTVTGTLVKFKAWDQEFGFVLDDAVKGENIPVTVTVVNNK